MNKLLKYLPAALIVASAFVGGVAHAQVTAPNYFLKVATSVYPLNPASTTFGTSTLNGVFKNINVNGTCTGCGAGGSATSTINGVTGPTFTFSVVSTSSASSVTTSSQNIFLNLLKYTSSTDITITSTGTIVFANHNISQFTNDSAYITSSPSSLNVGGVVTSTAIETGTSSINSVVPLLNASIFIPNQAYLTTYGCPFGFSSDHTVDTCANDLYNNNSSTASSTDFYLANGTYTWSDPTGFKFTNSGEQAQLHCAAGDGTRLVDNAATGTIGTIRWGTVPTAGAGVFGCSFFGLNTVATISTSTGNVGWLVQAPYVTFRDNHYTQFSNQIYLDTNTYLDKIEDNYFGFAGLHEVYAPNSNNSGESNTLLNNTFATLGNNTTSACVYLNTQSTNITGGSNDGCTIEVGGLAHVSMSGVHHETINTGSYGAYYPVQVDAGGVLTEVNGDYMNDGVGASSSVGFINNSGFVYEKNATLWANPSSTANFVTGTGSSTIDGVDISHSAGTQIAPTSSVSVANGTGVQYSQGNMIWGTVTMTTAANNFTVTYAKAFNFKPNCGAVNATSSANIIRSIITTTSTMQALDTSNFPTSSVENWWCFGMPN